MTHLPWIAVVNATWLLATGRDVAETRRPSTRTVPERRALHKLSLEVGDELRLQCNHSAVALSNATFAWFFNGFAIPPNPRPDLYRYRVVTELAGRQPYSISYSSSLEMGRCRSAHTGVYTCQSIVGGTVMNEHRFDVNVRIDGRKRARLNVDTGKDIEASAALLSRRYRRWLAPGRRWSFASALVGQACDNDELCAETDPVSLCEGGLCICAPTFSLEGKHCVKKVGRYQSCGAQVKCRGNSMSCSEGICECFQEDEHDSDCRAKSGPSTLAKVMIYTAISVALFAAGFVLFYAFCQKRYDLDDQLEGAFIITCVIL